MFIDTTEIQGKPSYEMYLAGQEGFLHINLDKGYWQGREGGGAMIFHTRFPDKFDSLILAWKQYYPDSLYQKLLQMKDFEVGEVAIHHKKDSLSPVKPSFYPVFVSFSAGGYRNWGIPDIAISKRHYHEAVC